MRSTDWIKGLDDKEAEDFLNRLSRSQFMLDKIVKIASDKIKEINRPSKSDYDSPSWLARQAHENGNVEAFNYIIDLCTLDQREKV